MAKTIQVTWAPLRRALLIWLGYTSIGIVVFLPLVTRLNTHILADDVFIEPGRSDAYNFLWTYWWIQKAALSGINIYHCNWVLPPTGANLYFHTHVVLPTLLTLPLGMLMGSVAGYNSMIILMLSGAASVYYAFLRRTFGLQFLPAFIVGALFGFSPYFVFKTHAHVNIVGAVFWAGALAVIVHAYAHEQFGWRQGMLLSVCLWATFWTSFVEFFALIVVSACTVAVFAATTFIRTRRVGSWKEAAFFGMTIPGAISLLSLQNAPNAGALEIAPFPNVQLRDLVIPARLSVLGGSFKVSEFEYWGSHVPIVFIALLAVGVCTPWRGSARQTVRPMLLMAAAAAILTLNPLGAPLAIIRKLPFGMGFRVAGRFLPFFYFVMLVPAAFGLQHLLRVRNRWVLAASVGSLSILGFVELYPVKLSPSKVKTFDVPAQLAKDGASAPFTLIMPRGAYTNVLDTYQVSMNVPVVHLSYLAREDPEVTSERTHRFPGLYPAPRKLTGRVLSEMREAHVGYVLFEDRLRYDAEKLKGAVVAEQDGAILVRVDDNAP